MVRGQLPRDDLDLDRDLFRGGLVGHHRQRQRDGVLDTVRSITRCNGEGGMKGRMGWDGMGDVMGREGGGRTQFGAHGAGVRG